LVAAIIIGRSKKNDAGDKFLKFHKNMRLFCLLSCTLLGVVTCFRTFFSRQIGSSVTRLKMAIDLEYFNRPGAWDDKDLGSLLNANKNWCNRITNENPNFFQEIRRGHAPKILWIGCR
jgi:hypothetical protein